MARLATFGYELGEINEFGAGAVQGDVTGSPTVDSANARAGRGAMKCLGSSATAQYHRIFSLISVLDRTYRYRFYWKASANTSKNQVKIGRITPNAVEQASIRLETGGTLSLYNAAGTKVGESSAQVEAGHWYRIEFEVKIPTSGKGTIGLFLNGAQIARSTEQEVGNSVTNAHIIFGKGTAAESPDMYYDDIAINDDQGASQNSFPGSGVVAVLLPVEDSAREGWLAGAGGTENLFDALNNVPPVGVALASATNTSQVKLSESSSTAALDVKLAAYTTAVASGGGGLGASDLVSLVVPFAKGGNNTTTNRTLGVAMVSNPTISLVSSFVGTTIAGTEPTGWTMVFGTTTYAPAVTKGNKPVLRLRKGAAQADTMMAESAGLIVEYIPAVIYEDSGTAAATVAPTGKDVAATADAGTAGATVAPTGKEAGGGAESGTAAATVSATGKDAVSASDHGTAGLDLEATGKESSSASGDSGTVALGAAPTGKETAGAKDSGAAGVGLSVAGTETHRRAKPITRDFFPTEIHEEAEGATPWVNPANILDKDADLATVTGGGSGKIASLRLGAFKIADLIEEGSVITAVKVVYKVERVGGSGEDNPITGIRVQTGTGEKLKVVTQELFGESWQEVEGEAVPVALTEIVVDLSAHDWTLTELGDVAPLYADVRCRDNSGHTSDFAWQYAGVFRITYIPPPAPKPGSKVLVHEDPQTEEDVIPVWGDGEGHNGIGPEGFELFSTGGDTRPKGDGSPSNGHRRRYKIKDGDRAEGDSPTVERNETAFNERRNHLASPTNPDGTFVLYEPGKEYETWFTANFDSGYPIETNHWQLFMQMKQAQPYTDDGFSSPIVALQARQGEFQAIIQPDHNESSPLWSCPATLGVNVRFRILAFYAGDGPHEQGWLQIQVDDRAGEPTDFVPQHDSGKMLHRTLTNAVGDQEGPGWALKDGEPFDSHLRLGIYRDALVEGPTHVDFSNIQAYWIVPSVRPVALRVRENPSMRQYLMATTPGGKTYRWSEDETYADHVLEGLQDSDSVPGGFKELTGSLGRKPGVDYGDLQRGTRIEVWGAGQQKISEYRLERAPRTAGDKLVVNPAANGYQAALSDDESAREIFIDSDMTAWGEPSAQRRAEHPTQKINTDGQVQLLPAGTPETEEPKTYLNVPAISHAFAQVNNNEGKEPDTAESWYDANGIELGELLLEFIAVKGLGSWTDQIETSVDGVILKEKLHDFAGSSATGQQSFPVAADRFFLMLRDFFEPSFSGATNAEAQWRNLKVLGRHGLTLQGSWPNVGFLASDVIAYALQRWAPFLDFTTGPQGSIRPTTLPIPQLAFKEQTTVQEMVTKTLATEMLEWGVWCGQKGPTFYLNQRGEREGRKRWRARVRPAKLEETGPQMDKVYNGVLVSYQDPGGETRVVGPPGSGCQITSEQLLDADPLNPANELGIRRWKKISIGVSTETGALRAGEYFLAYSKEHDGSGTATLTGFVEDDAGMLWPYYCVHAGDLIEFVDSSDTSPRYIIEANRSRQSRSVQIQLDQPPDSEQALAERFNMSLVESGLSQ